MLMKTLNFPKVRFDNAVWIPMSILARVEGKIVPVPQDDVRDFDGVGSCISEDAFNRMLDDGVLDRDAWIGNKGDTILEETGFIDDIFPSTPQLPVAPNMNCGQLAKCVQTMSEKYLQLMLDPMKSNEPVKIIQSADLCTREDVDDPAESFHDSVVEIKAAARKFNEYKDLAQSLGLSMQLLSTWQYGYCIEIDFILAGKGIFYSRPMFLNLDVFGSLRRLGDGSITFNLATPEYESDDFVVLRPVAGARDFGAFSALENIFWVMSHMSPIKTFDEIYRYDCGSIYVDIEPEHYIKFANPYLVPEYMMFSGLPEAPEISSEYVSEDEIAEACKGS